MIGFTVMDDGLWAEFVDGSRDLLDYVFLEPHDTIARIWKVESEDPTHVINLESVMTRYGTVSVWGLEPFVTEAEAKGYEVVFMEDPTAALDWADSLSGNPQVKVESRLEGRIDRNGNPLRLINGFLPFQAQGINFMKTMKRAVYFEWSTGTGKTLAAEGTILWKREHDYGLGDKGFDLCLYVVKPNNMENTRRKLLEHTGLEGVVVAGTPAKREKQFMEAWLDIKDGKQPILIFNAEKFNEDKEGFMTLVEMHDILVIFDEMPTKYSNRGTLLYRNTCEILYTSFVVSQAKKSKGKKVFYPAPQKYRAKQMFCVAMSATPIRNSPEDAFNQIRILDPELLGSINDFEKQHAGPRDQWRRVLSWHHLDLFGMRVAQITHSADKEKDPEIAAQFPRKLPPEVVFSVMDKNSERLYKAFEAQYDFQAIRNGTSLIDWDEILAAIQVLQYICSNPRAVLESARKWGLYECARIAMMEEIIPTVKWASKKERADFIKDWDKKHKDGSEVAYKFVKHVNDDTMFTDRDKDGNCVIGKMNDMRERIEAHDDKVIVFTAMNDSMLPLIAEWFDEWGITYVTYHGGMSAKQKQIAQDSFREDPDIQVFLSSDAGQDSIDLPEASLTCHYDWPWVWAIIQQRQNRQDRIDSEKESVQTITFTFPGTVEDRKAEIVVIKKGYHDQVYGGEVADQSEALSRSSYIYMLTGDPS